MLKYILLNLFIDLLSLRLPKKHKNISFTYTISTLNGLIFALYSIKNIFRRDLDNLTNMDKEIINMMKAYYLYDSLKMIIRKQYNINYLVHHCISYMSCNLTVKYNMKKDFTYGLFLGEITNPLLNFMFLSKKFNFIKTNKLLIKLFSYSFVPIRCVVMPIWLYYFNKRINKKELTGLEKNIITSIIILFNLGNFMWAKKLIYK